MDTKEKIGLFKELFINRHDVYPLQLKQGQWILKKDTLTDEIIEKHLTYKITIGCYSGMDSTTKWLCIDIDSLAIKNINEVQQKAEHFSIPVYYEFSGRKGYHCWIFFSKPAPNSKARRLGNMLTSKSEIFPKQNFTSKKNVGNLVKGPLGIHRVTNKLCLFVDKNLNKIPEQWHYLMNIRKIDIDEVFKRLHIKEEKTLLHSTKHNEENKLNRKTPAMIKPCVKQALINGICTGKRNKVGHIIASECRRLKKSEEEARGMLTAWNFRNKPPLAGREINIILYSAYHVNEYEYGCKPGGILMQLLGCVGRSRCKYYCMLSEKRFKNRIKTQRRKYYRQ